MNEYGFIELLCMKMFLSSFVNGKIAVQHLLVAEEEAGVWRLYFQYNPIYISNISKSWSSVHDQMIVNNSRKLSLGVLFFPSDLEGCSVCEMRVQVPLPSGSFTWGPYHAGCCDVGCCAVGGYHVGCCHVGCCHVGLSC